MASARRMVGLQKDDFKWENVVLKPPFITSFLLLSLFGRDIKQTAEKRKRGVTA